MNSTTLRGIFPEQKTVHRRNFMRDNIKQLKTMQTTENRKVTTGTLPPHPLAQKYKNITSKVSQAPAEAPARAPYRRSRSSWSSTPDIHRKTQSVQTERDEDMKRMHEMGGKIKYATPLQTPKPKATPAAKTGEMSARHVGDTTVADLTKDMQKMEVDAGKEQDKQFFINKNKQIKPKVKGDLKPDPIQPPPGYQKGVLPKYLKDMKDSSATTPMASGRMGKGPISDRGEGENVAGMILLPDEERREYLRVARENYAALIKELNGMPVRNDTLKRRKRKIEIEEELKRLDEVIKIFQKPKVYVKADS